AVRAFVRRDDERAQSLRRMGAQVFVGDKSYMTYDRMTAPREERLAWLGGLIADWSPQQRAHWIAEQALNWSDLPVVNIRATIFVENPLLTWYPLKAALDTGELRRPFGARKFAPIA